MKGFLEKFNYSEISGWVSFDPGEYQEILFQFNDCELKKLDLILGDRYDLTSKNISHFLFTIKLDSDLLNTPVVLKFYNNKNELILDTPRTIETNQTELKKVLIGKSGWLFLANDTNNYLSYYRENKSLDINVISSWREETAKRNLIAKLLNSNLRSFIVPEKTYLYSEYLPDNYQGKKNCILDNFRNDKILSHYIIPEFSYEVDGFTPDTELYYKGDTHWNYYGAYHFYIDIITSLGLEDEILNFKDNFKAKKYFMSGDLRTKIADVNVELVDHISPYKTNFKIIYDNNLKTTGRIEEFFNPDAINSSKVIIFHTSSIDWVKPYLLSHFKYVKLVWDKNIDWDIVIDYCPEHIIYQTNERFLFTSPSISTFSPQQGYNTISDYINSINYYLEEQIRNKNVLCKKINILIEEPNLNTSKPSLISAFKNDVLFDVKILSHTQTQKVREYYEKLDVDVIYGGNLESICAKYDIDIMFIANPHRYFECTVPTYDFYKKISNNLLYTTLFAYVPYAFLCMSDNHAFDDVIQRYVWKFFLETNYHLGSINSDLDRIDNAHVTGHPYLDAYKNFEISNHNKLTILWCPHHNPVFYNDITLFEQDMALREILNHEKVEIIFRPHPNLLQTLNSLIHKNSKHYKTLLSEVDAAQFISFWENHPKVICDYNSPIEHLFSKSDLLITNCGGFQMESICTGLPIINLINRDLLSNFMKEFSPHYNFANKNEEFKVLLDDFLNGRINKSNRSEILKIIPSIGQAGENIVNTIKNHFRA